MKSFINHLLPKDWTKSLSEEEIDALRQAFEISRKSRLKEGAKFDFFGGATLDLDSVFISPERGDSIVDYFVDDNKQVA